MVDGSVVQFPEVNGANLAWRRFWDSAVRASENLRERGSEDIVVVDELIGQLTQKLAEEDELEAAAFLVGSEHEDPYVRAATASKLHLLCFSEFEQGVSLALLLSEDADSMVQTRVVESMQSYLSLSDETVSSIENDRRIRDILSKTTTGLSYQLKQSDLDRHPSAGEEPGGAA